MNKKVEIMQHSIYSQEYGRFFLIKLSEKVEKNSIVKETREDYKLLQCIGESFQINLSGDISDTALIERTTTLLDDIKKSNTFIVGSLKIEERLLTNDGELIVVASMQDSNINDSLTIFCEENEENQKQTTKSRAAEKKLGAFMPAKKFGIVRLTEGITVCIIAYSREEEQEAISSSIKLQRDKTQKL